MTGPSIIIDGLTSDSARVDKQNRLSTLAVTKRQIVSSSLDGDAFFISTGLINLTSDSESWLLSVRNNESMDWIVESLFASYGASDGTGDIQNRFASGASTGTLFSAGLDIPASNLNLGSAKELDATVKVGAEASTVTDGLQSLPVLIPEGTRSVLFPAGPLVIAPGTSLSAAFTPPTGNTDMNVLIQMNVYREDL